MRIRTANSLLALAILGVTSAAFAQAPATQNEANVGPAVTIYSSADPAGFDPQRGPSGMSGGLLRP